MSVAAVEVARPFIKSAGGKDKLWPQLAPLLPETFDCYLEPFVGGGAVFYRIRQMRSSPDERRFVLGDLNKGLVLTYGVVQAQVEVLIDNLTALEAEDSEEQYYAVRDVFNERAGTGFKNVTSDAVEVAAMYIYLNKTGYNGLFRVNRDGKYNNPYGKKALKNRVICDAKNLRECSRALRGVTLQHDSYEEIVQQAKKGDFVYFDPPYYPLNGESFTAYTKEPFGPKEHEMLAEVACILNEEGVYVMLSNADHPQVRKLYDGWDVREIKAARAIASKGDRRGKINELVIRNYE